MEDRSVQDHPLLDGLLAVDFGRVQSTNCSIGRCHETGIVVLSNGCLPSGMGDQLVQGLRLLGVPLSLVLRLLMGGNVAMWVWEQ